MANGFVLRNVSDKERRGRTWLAAALTVVSAIAGAMVVPLMGDGEFVYLLWALYAGYMCLCVVYIYKCWVTRQVREPSPEVKAAAVAREQEELRKAHEFESKWYFRYPMAALMAGCGIYLIVEKERVWWLGALLCIVALFQAWEMLLLGLLVGAIYLVFKGIAALPISVAIVVGALIIASVLDRRKA